jgi:putative DNA primase/helicase
MQRLPKLTAAMLHPQAEGRWLDIFRYLCPGMFDEAIEKLGTHVTCPFHGGSEDFRFSKRSTKKGGNTAQSGVAMCTCGVYADGFAVLHKARGGRFIDVLKEVNEYLNGPEPTSAPIRKALPVAVAKTISAEEQAAKDAELLAKVKALWSNGKLFDPQVYAYYIERGIDPRILDDLQDVRTMASLGYWHTVDKKLVKLGSFPALLALMRDKDGNPAAVHRTWLSQDRKAKAPVPKAKKLSETPNAAGAAIRLFDAEGTDVLGLTEGVETAIGVRQLGVGGYFDGLGKIPVWACFAERNIRNFQIPESLLDTLTKIIIFADNDERGTGLAAATAFKDRMAVEQPHLVVEIKLPEVVGHDWLDVLVNL